MAFLSIRQVNHLTQWSDPGFCSDDVSSLQGKSGCMVFCPTTSNAAGMEFWGRG